MTATPRSYRLTSRAEGHDLLEALGREFSLRQIRRPVERTVTYFDTFDRRIHRDGGLLFTSDSPGGPVLIWERRGKRLRVTLEAPPAFTWDLPAGPFRQKLEKTIEMRRLLPLLRLESTDERVAVLDPEDKTVARIAITREEVTDSETGKRQAVPERLRLEPVRGYDRAFARVADSLERDLGLDRIETRELDLALDTLGKSPDPPAGKPRIELQPELAAGEAMGIVHRALLEAMLGNEPGVRLDLDSEFLHDFRVAGRRTRSALTQIKGVYPQPVVDRFRRELAWLGGVTGPTRDLDVYLLNMPSYRRALPRDVRPHLEPLEAFLHRHQKRAHRRLVRSLDTRRYRRLLQDWRQFLHGPETDEKEPPENALFPIEPIASARIRKAYRRVLRRGEAIDSSSPASDLHRLRIDCKKLRYLLEIFRSLYDAAAIRSLIKDLKLVQDNLGTFNDLEIQQDSLRDFATRMMGESEPPAETLLAMGRLVEQLESRQAEERSRFDERFAAFSAPRCRKSYRRLFAKTRDESR